ncbi:MAG: MBL fold metallo-hydrolase [Planctomycetota bacterium]|jgi:glyoxylase-like metal-dependent hydrolase (beta-lactamase superfamily II)
MPAFREAYALLSSRVVLPRRLLERGSRGRYPLPVLSFALRADEGIWLVDAGLFSTQFLPRRLAQGWDPTERLAQIGARREDVRGIAVTHLDYDHTGLFPHLPDVPIYLSESEFASTRRVTPLHLRCSKRDLRSARGWQPQSLAFTNDAGPFQQAVDVFGDGSLRLVDLAGHSRGHAGVWVRLTSGRELLFCGDAAFTCGNLEGRDLGLFPTRVAWNRPRVLASLAKLRRFGQERPDVTIIPSHAARFGEEAIDAPLKL